MATNRAVTKLMLLRKSHGHRSPLYLILRGRGDSSFHNISPTAANILSQTRLRKAAAAAGSRNIVLSQDQSSHCFGVGAGAARLDAAAVDWDNTLLSWRFGESRRTTDGSLLARGRKPVSDDDVDSDIDSDSPDFDDMVDSDIEDLLDDDNDCDEDDLDEEETVELKKGSKGKK